MILKKKIVSLAAVFALGSTVAAQAATAPLISLPVSVVVSSSCAVSSSGGFTNFTSGGALGTGLFTGVATAAATLTYTQGCNAAALTSLTLTGLNASTTSFRLANGANFLPYTITENATTNTPTGEQFNAPLPSALTGFVSGTPYAFTTSASTSALTTALTATLGSATLVAGTYTDTVSVSVAFV